MRMPKEKEIFSFETGETTIKTEDAALFVVILEYFKGRISGDLDTEIKRIKNSLKNK